MFPFHPLFFEIMIPYVSVKHGNEHFPDLVDFPAINLHLLPGFPIVSSAFSDGVSTPSFGGFPGISLKNLITEDAFIFVSSSSKDGPETIINTSIDIFSSGFSNGFSISFGVFSG